MAAPSKVWVILPTVITSAPIPIVQYTDETEADKAAVKASITTGTQYYILEAVKYADPEIVPAVVSAVVHDIV